MFNEKVLDKYFKNEDDSVFTSGFKNEQEANKYIENLRKKHNIKVNYIAEKNLNVSYFYDPNLLKVILIPVKKAIEKNI